MTFEQKLAASQIFIRGGLMGNSGNYDTGTGELAPRAGEFLAGVLALSRISRVTVALESGHGAGPALLAAARMTAHAETCLLFDQWHGNPLADLAAALADAHPDLVVAADGSLAQGLRNLQSRERRSFLVILDRFDAYLAQPADAPQVAAFDRAFVQMANDSELDVHFLLVQDEAAEHLLARFQDAIPGIGDGCLRMPAGAVADPRDGASAPETSRISRRDRSFGMLLERLTAIAPGDEAGTSQPAISQPVISQPAIDPAAISPTAALPPAEVRQLLDDIAPLHDYQPVVDHTTVNDVPLARREPVLSRPEPAIAPLPAAGIDEPVALPEPPPVRLAPAELPAQRTALPAASPRRGKALAALMAAVLAVGAGLYAYRHQAPAPGAASTPSAPASPPAAAEVVAPAGETAVAATPSIKPDQTPPASAGPALATAPTLAAAAPSPPVAAPDPVTAAAASPAAVRTAPTVYVHVRSQRERDRLQALTRTLAAQGIRVVDVKVMSKGPSVADLRYFRDEDRETALKVQKALASAGVPVPRLSRMNGFEGSTRPGHFEAWLSGARMPEPLRRR
jgi:hypothetical protein